MRLKHRWFITWLWVGIGLSVNAQVSAQFAPRQAKGKVTYAAINEASGLVASVANPRCFWTHNDSGDQARIFLIDDSARHRATYYLEGVQARDWEDIGMMERHGKHYLLVGDIGDNKGQYPHVQVHVVEEPAVSADIPRTDTISKTLIRSYTLTYSDGPRDAEALFFDPIDDCLYVISKRDLKVGLYVTKLPDTPVSTLVLRKVGQLPHTFITAADIRLDGTEILMKNLLEVFYWKRNPALTIPETLQQPAVKLDYQPEPQGEAIAFSIDRNGYYTLSEAAFGLVPYLYFYRQQD